jgi:hypothetical protein
VYVTWKRVNFKNSSQPRMLYTVFQDEVAATRKAIESKLTLSLYLEYLIPSFCGVPALIFVFVATPSDMHVHVPVTVNVLVPVQYLEILQFLVFAHSCCSR